MDAKKWIQGIVIGGTLLAVSHGAQAFCSISGEIARVTAYPGASSSYIYIRPTSLSTYYFYTITSDAKLIDAALSGMSNKRISVTGDAASCPTTGTSRYMGVTTNVVVNP